MLRDSGPAVDHPGIFINISAMIMGISRQKISSRIDHFSVTALVEGQRVDLPSKSDGCRWVSLVLTGWGDTCKSSAFLHEKPHQCLPSITSLSPFFKLRPFRALPIDRHLMFPARRWRSALIYASFTWAVPFWGAELLRGAASCSDLPIIAALLVELLSREVLFLCWLVASPMHEGVLVLISRVAAPLRWSGDVTTFHERGFSSSASYVTLHVSPLLQSPFTRTSLKWCFEAR